MPWPQTKGPGTATETAVHFVNGYVFPDVEVGMRKAVPGKATEVRLPEGSQASQEASVVSPESNDSKDAMLPCV